jgi:uncharacterized protein YdaT
MTEKVQIEFEGVDKLTAVSNKVQSELDATATKTKAANNTAKISFTEVASALNLVQQGLQLAGKAYDATVGSTLKYANEVRQLSQISGESAENTSRFIQVLDDYKIGTDDALTATRALTKQGLSPSIDTLAKLSDQYRKLSSAEEKNAFIMKNLGKSGLQWVEVLNKGSAAILKQGDAVADGLILNQKQLDAARELEIAQDNLGESWQQISMTIGNKAIPAMTSAIDEFNNTSRAIEIMTESGMGWFEVLDNMAAMSPAYLDALKQANEETLAGRDAMLQNSEAVEENTASLEAQEAKIKAVSQANQEFMSALMGVDAAMDTFQEGMAEVDAALADGSISVDEHKAKVAELEAQYEESTNRIILSIVESRLAIDGWTQAETHAYLEAGKQLGVFTQETVNKTHEIINEVDATIAGFGELGSQMYHTGERAVDAADDFGVMGEGAAALGDEIRSNALPAVGGLKSQINGLPPSGSAWAYSFTISVKGRVPSLPNNQGVDGSGLCFVRGTPVTLSDGTTKPIEQVQPGDEVRSYDTERGEFVVGVVVKIITRDVVEYLSIDGILVTPEHPFWIVDRGEWVKAGELKRGDILLRDNGGFQIVKHIFHIRSGVEVFNMTVEGVHNYFAGGVLVHNKQVGDDDMDTPHASGGVFMIPQRYGNEGFRLGNGDTASGGEKLAIAPQGKDFIDYNKLAALMPHIDEKRLARSIVSAMSQVDW